jgi:hypothetical protein
MPENKPELTFEQKVELFRQTADSMPARAEYAYTRAEVILPLINAQSTVRAIFRPTRLAPGASSTFDVPFDDIDCCWMMPHIGGIPVVQVEGTSINVDTFGLDGGVEYQEDVARDGRIDVATLSTTLLKNKFIVQEELAGWTLIQTHAAALPALQIVAAMDKDGLNVVAGTGAASVLNVHTINEIITTADEIGIGGRRVTDIYCSPRRFGDLREQMTISALTSGIPDSIREKLWDGGQGPKDHMQPSTFADIRIHRVYNPALVDNNTVYAFTQKEGYFYGVMPIREELKTRDNPQAAGEWKIGILGKERVGFGVLDNLGLIVCQF